MIGAAVKSASQEVAAALRVRRLADMELFERRIRADVAVGALPADTDAVALARYVVPVLQGTSRQSRDGAKREDLQAVAEPAIRAWPHWAAPAEFLWATVPGRDPQPARHRSPEYLRPAGVRFPAAGWEAACAVRAERAATSIRPPVRGGRKLTSIVD